MKGLVPQARIYPLCRLMSVLYIGMNMLPVTAQVYNGLKYKITVKSTISPEGLEGILDKSVSSKIKKN